MEASQEDCLLHVCWYQLCDLSNSFYNLQQANGRINEKKSIIAAKMVQRTDAVGVIGIYGMGTIITGAILN